MSITVNHIEKLIPAGGMDQSITIECDMTHRDMEDIVAQVCEQMGDDVFLEYIKQMII